MVSGRSSDTGDLVVSSLGIRHRERSSRSKADRGLSSPPYHQIWPNCRCLLGGIRLGTLELACWTDRRGDRDVELHRSASKAHLQARLGTGEWLRLGIDPARWMLTSVNQSRILSIVIGKDRIRLRDLAMFNCALDAKLRACDLVKLRVSDVAPGGSADPAFVR